MGWSANVSMLVGRMNPVSAAATAGLFQPLTVGSLTIPNRIVMAPMTRNFSPGGVPGPNVAAYYRRRAENGVGLIMTKVDVPVIPVRIFGSGAAMPRGGGLAPASSTAPGPDRPSRRHRRRGAGIGP